MRKKSQIWPYLRHLARSAILVPLVFAAYAVVAAIADDRLPTGEHPAELYANQLRHDLRKMLINAIQKAEKSVMLMTYTISDRHIIAALKAKADQGVPVTVIVDAKASPKAKIQLGAGVETLRRSSAGLMHLKILVIDETQIWLGSTNLTYDSLRTHGNLIVEMDHKELAQQLLARARALPRSGLAPVADPVCFTLPEQTGELWFLPSAGQALQRILDQIATAQKSVKVAMFTWTHPDFTRAMIAAQGRGVHVEVVIDRRQGQGVGAETVHQLTRAGIPVYLSCGDGLLHHKTLMIDDRILVTGSANWTRSAFRINDDCFLMLEPLTQRQKDCLDQLWAVLLLEGEIISSIE